MFSQAERKLRPYSQWPLFLQWLLLFKFREFTGMNNSPGIFLIFPEQAQSYACAQSSKLPGTSEILARPPAIPYAGSPC